MKVYVVEVRYDLETSYIVGTFTDKYVAEEIAKECNRDGAEFGKGSVTEYTLDEQ